MFDDNTTLIVLALISAFGVVFTGMVSLLSLRYTAKATAISKANTQTLTQVAHAVNGMTQARVDAATSAGDVKAEVARAEGVAEERARTPTPSIAPIVDKKE